MANLTLHPAAAAVNGPISDMDRITALRAALQRIVECGNNPDRSNAGARDVMATYANAALQHDDRLADAQDAAQTADRTAQVLEDFAACAVPESEESWLDGFQKGAEMASL